MASGKCIYLRQAILDLILGGTAWTPPTDLYVALSTANFTPWATGDNLSELPAINGYGRAQVVNDSTGWPAADGSGNKTNLQPWVYDSVSADWGTVVSYYLLDDAGVGLGNALYGSDLIAAQDVFEGVGPRFPAGTVDVSEF